MKLWKTVAAVAAGTVGALVVWAAGIEPHLISEEEETAHIPNLPSSWEGQRVAVIADLQVGMWLANTRTTQRIVRKIVEARPALVLLAGDYVYLPKEDYKREIGLALELLRPLTDAGLSTYAVLGNHDYAMLSERSHANVDLAEEVTRGLESIGIPVLNNEVVRLESPVSNGPRDEKPLYLVGLGEARASADDPQAALAQLPEQASRIILVHNPATFARLPAGSAPFVAAGHTHGGQIRIPFTPEWVWERIQGPGEIHECGWVHGFGEPENRLYVNRGVGFSVLPIRFNCPPELTWFTLMRGNPT